MYVYYMSICLTSGSYQQKQNAGKIQRNIKTYKTFLVQALINHIMVSVLPPDCPTLPDGHVWRLHLLGWIRIDSTQCFLMAFRSAAHLGPVATSTPVRTESPHRDYNDTTISLAMATATRVACNKRHPGAARARPWQRRSGLQFCVPQGGGGNGISDVILHVWILSDLSHRMRYRIYRINCIYCMQSHEITCDRMRSHAIACDKCNKNLLDMTVWLSETVWGFFRGNENLPECFFMTFANGFFIQYCFSIFAQKRN